MKEAEHCFPWRSGIARFLIFTLVLMAVMAAAQSGWKPPSVAELPPDSGKSDGKEAKLSYSGNLLVENRNGLIDLVQNQKPRRAPTPPSERCPGTK